MWCFTFTVVPYCYSSIPEDKQRAIVHTGQHSSFYQCGSLCESTIYVCARLFGSLTPHKYLLCTVTLASATPSTVTGSTTGSTSTATEHPSDVTVFGYRRFEIRLSDDPSKIRPTTDNNWSYVVTYCGWYSQCTAYHPPRPKAHPSRNCCTGT